MGALTATLAGCSSCPLPPQPGMKSCSGTNGFACFDRTAARQPIAPKPVSFKTNSAPLEIRTAIAAKTEKLSSAHARDTAHLATKTEKPATIPLPPRSLQPTTGAAPDSDTTRANTADSPADGAVPSSTTRTIQEQVAAATAVAERMTVAILVAAPEPNNNNKDRSDRSETVLRGDAEKTAPSQPNKLPFLVYLLMARPEIKSVSDLTSKIIAIDDGHSASNIRTAIVAAGASEVQLSNSQTKAIDRVVSGEVSAAVLTLVSPEAAEGFPEIAGFKIFRIALSPRYISPR
jgi:hypothetical protein